MSCEVDRYSPLLGEQDGSDVVIHVQNLAKYYQIYDAPRDRLKQFILPRLRRFAGKPEREYFRQFSALENISFEVRRGETVGVIGRNGAGKSTLLQIICGTLTPSIGTVEIRGRVAALLELGSGFNTEFSGRENIIMNAGVLGLSKEEIDARFDDIVAFADIGDFLDQPVKVYSSGMYVRLAFAVVVHVDADILIVDEALAVGDLAFQAKCMMALKRLMDAGTTVLFVSHDTSSVRNLCQKVLWLENGKIKAFGDPELTIGKYVAEAHLSINSSLAEVRGNPERPGPGAAATEQASFSGMPDFGSFSEGWRRYGDGRALVMNAVLLNAESLPVETICLRENFVIRFLVHAQSNVENPAFGFSFRDLKGNQVVGSVTTNYRNAAPVRLEAGHDYTVEVRGTNILAQGSYTLNLGIENIIEKNIAHEFVDVVENAIVFRSSFGDDICDVFPAMVWQDMIFDVRECR